MRIFTVMEPKGIFPTSVKIGQYVLPLSVRYAGQPPRCYRCGSDQHRIAQCPKPPSYRRCYTCGSEDHVHKHCPGNINRSSIVTATEHLEHVVHPEPTGNNAATQVSSMTENVETKADDMNDANQSISGHTSDSGMESDQSVLIRRSRRKKRCRQPSPPDETSQSKAAFQEPQNHKKETNFRRQRKNRNRNIQILPIRI